MRSKLILILLAVLFLSGISKASSVNFSQLDFDLDGVISTNTEWGAVDLTFIETTEIQYFNLGINGSWTIQNMPVYSMVETGANETWRFTFDLGVQRGTNVSSLNYDYTLTNTIQSTSPGNSLLATVEDYSVRLYSGFDDVPLGTLGSPTVQWNGGVLLDAPHGHAWFPNQACGTNECAPTAVSNSLKFLKETHPDLTMPDSEITIAKMKDATKWKVPPRKIGCYIYDNTNGNAWWKDKDAYIKSKGWNITTKVITFEGKTEAERIAAVKALQKEMDDKQDIEIQVAGHTASLVRLSTMSDGKFAFVVNHDIKQINDVSGCVTEALHYDPATNQLGGIYTSNRDLLYAVVECPEPTTILLLSLGGLILRRRK